MQPTTVRDNVRAAMTAADVSQARLAEALGITQQAVSAKLRNDNPIEFSVAQLVAAAHILNVPVTTLIEQVAA